MPRYKYSALARYLITQPTDRVTLTLPQIAAIVGAPLPVRAQHATFWRNDQRSQFPTWAWRAVGWHVAERVYQPPTWVITFERDGAASAGTGQSA